MNDLLVELITQQTASGGYPSNVYFQRQTLPDTNGFMTALILRELSRISYPLSSTITQRALDFLQTCQSAKCIGLFNFYPPTATPPWIKNLPDDVDDTAIIALELFRHKRIDRTFVLKHICSSISNVRLKKIDTPAPVWLQPGVFFTWFQNSEHRNIVDCCVNANVVALFSAAGITHWKGYMEACQMIEEGIRWAGNHKERAKLLTPFYADPVELWYAVRNAIEQGAIHLQASLDLLRQMSWAIEEGSQMLERPICSSAYGAIVWKSEILQKVRQMINYHLQSIS